MPLSAPIEGTFQVQQRPIIIQQWQAGCFPFYIRPKSDATTKRLSQYPPKLEFPLFLCQKPLRFSPERGKTEKYPTEISHDSVGSSDLPLTRYGRRSRYECVRVHLECCPTTKCGRR